MPREKDETLKIRGTLDEVLRTAFVPTKKTAKAAPKKRSRPRKGQK
jgi:hypothetical protein